MRQSIRTAKDIYSEISRLNDELREIGQGLDDLEDRQGSLPYNIVKKAYEEKKRELNKAERQEFVTRAAAGEAANLFE